MLILSVDIGTRNFGMTVYCTELQEFTLMKIKDLRFVKDFVKHMKIMSEEEPFKSADVILVENQMRSIMKTMATAIRAFNFEKTVMVSPMSVKRFFQICSGYHKTNKSLARVEAPKLLSEKNLSTYNSFKKKDDIADCILQTYWYLNKHMNDCRKLKKKVNKGRLMKVPAHLKPK